MSDKSSGALTTAVASGFDDCPIPSEEWDKTVRSLGGPVYMTFDWLRTWWEFYGAGSLLRLFVFQADARPVGLLPMYFTRIGRRPLNLSIARVVGAPIPPKVFDPPMDDAWRAECVEQAVRVLLAKDAVDLVSLGPVTGTAARWVEGTPLQRRLADVALWTAAAQDVYTVFHLPPRMDEYLASLSRNEQKNRRKYELRTLRKEYAVRVEVVTNPVTELLAEFDRFAEQHTAQWRAEGRPGHFGAWPDALAYNRTLVTRVGARGRVRLLRIWANDKVVARQYAYAFGDRWWWELPSRIVGPQWDRFSLGPSAIVTMLQEAIREGVRQVEGGLGHYEYKLRLKGEEHPAVVLRAHARRAASRARQRVFGLMQFMGRVGYHKLWYRRISPHLPSKCCRSQPQWWLQLDY